MLGTSAKTLKYQTISDFTSPADYLSYMFGGVQGVMYRATIDPNYHQGYFRASGLIGATYAGVKNCYVAMNSFFRSSGLVVQDGRSVSHLKRLCALYVDIDCYKLGLSKNEVLLRLEDDFIGSRIPEPTFIIDSGRGIYLIWKLRNEDKKALPRWSAVQQYLTDTLAELGADQACMDAARILRVPFTVNSKSKTKVSIVEFNDLTYSIYEIMKEYEIPLNPKGRYACASRGAAATYPYNHATERQRKYVRDLARKLDLGVDELPDFASYADTDRWIKDHRGLVAAQESAGRGFSYQDGNTVSLSGFKAIKGVLGQYCAEIRKLFSLRKGANCKREIGLFLYRYFLREMKCSKEDALQETLAFNRSLNQPFEDDYVIKATASADRRIERGLPYAYRKSTIIKVLDITKTELANLPFLSADVKSQKERKREANRRAYENRLSEQGKIAKKDALLARRAALLSLKEQGKSAAEIQKTLGISRATYHRDLAALALSGVLKAVKNFIGSGKAKTIQGGDVAESPRSDLGERFEKTGAQTSVCCALRATVNVIKRAFQKACRYKSHFFSRSFIKKYSVAVPHRIVLYGIMRKLLYKNRERERRIFQPGDADDEDPDPC